MSIEKYLPPAVVLRSPFIIYRIAMNPRSFWGKLDVCDRKIAPASAFILVMSVICAVLANLDFLSSFSLFTSRVIFWAVVAFGEVYFSFFLYLLSWRIVGADIEQRYLLEKYFYQAGFLYLFLGMLLSFLNAILMRDLISMIRVMEFLTSDVTKLVIAPLAFLTICVCWLWPFWRGHQDSMKASLKQAILALVFYVFFLGLGGLIESYWIEGIENGGEMERESEIVLRRRVAHLVTDFFERK